MSGPSTIHLYYDGLAYPGGGIATYLDALARHAFAVGIPIRIAVVELNPSPLIPDLRAVGIPVDSQFRLPGDRWSVRKRALIWRLGRRLRPGDWVYAVCPPYPPVYETLVRTAHRRGAKVAVSWFLAPEFWAPIPQVMGQYGSSFCRAVAATDAVVSVSKCTAYQFAEVYGYNGPVKVVPYHNRLFFSDVLPFPPGPPWKIGFLGRLELDQKNLDTLIRAFGRLATERADIQLHLYGGGPDQAVLQELAKKCGVASNVSFHGVYDHRIDLPQILGGCHFFVHPSRYEGGPCFSLLEVMQAGRWCVVSAVGGIPDLYAGHPECGHLVPQCDDGTLLLDALRRGLDLAAAGALDPLAIRRRYHNGFDMASAHKAWLAALSLPVLMDIK